MELRARLKLETCRYYVQYKTYVNTFFQILYRFCIGLFFIGNRSLRSCEQLVCFYDYLQRQFELCAGVGGICVDAPVEACIACLLADFEAVVGESVELGDEFHEVLRAMAWVHRTGGNGDQIFVGEAPFRGAHRP